MIFLNNIMSIEYNVTLINNCQSKNGLLVATATGRKINEANDWETDNILLRGLSGLFFVTAADGGKRELQFEFRNLTRYPGCEGVAVRPWESLIGFSFRTQTIILVHSNPKIQVKNAFYPSICNSKGG